MAINYVNNCLEVRTGERIPIQLFRQRFICWKCGMVSFASCTLVYAVVIKMFEFFIQSVQLLFQKVYVLK